MPLNIQRLICNIFTYDFNFIKSRKKLQIKKEQKVQGCDATNAK